MGEISSRDRYVGIFGILLGIFCFGSFFIGNNENLIVPRSDIFLVKYSILITIINGGFYFIIVGILGLLGVYRLGNSEAQIENKKTKAKGTLLSFIILTPFFLAIFTTIFAISHGFLWKILGGFAIIYLGYLLYKSILTIRTR